MYRPDPESRTIWPSARPIKIFTLCFVHTDTHILLGMKKRGFGVDRWNGFGGKVHDGESVEAAARREVVEEAGIVPASLAKRGVLQFAFAGEPEVLEVHVFRVMQFAGDPIETEEMRPQWFALEAIPYDVMWADDRYWLPLFLAGKSLRGRFYYRDHHTIVHHSLEEVSANSL